MKWWPEKCKPGDMIRVKLGILYHYGIFVTEDEVIQFGHPIRDRLAKEQGKDIQVFAGSISEFAAGNMVETARLSLKECLERIPPQKTIALARSRIGETGYDLLHNNCEHFANMCVFGRNRCSQTEQIMEDWRKRPVLDVYVCPVDAMEGDNSDAVPLRKEQMQKVMDPLLQKQKTASWLLLEYAMMRSFGQRMRDRTFALDKYGKWTCDQLSFSISHTENWVAVAVSNQAVGVDIEEVQPFWQKDPALLASCLLTEAEKAQGYLPPEMLLRYWVSKESIYKCWGKGSFVPGRIAAKHEYCGVILPLEDMELALAVAGENLPKLRVYRYDRQGGAKPVATDHLEHV